MIWCNVSHIRVSRPKKKALTIIREELYLGLFYGVSQAYSRVAQLVEQLTVNQRVAGSSPATGAKILSADFSGSYLMQDPMG